ncbi:MAG: hypothetical protein LBM41_07520 [Ruminococcus sp.]|nr:hypothetical protein [Ruminococcus sp.]
MEYNGIPENYFIAFSGSGSLEINDSTITGTSNQPLIWIYDTISSALIKDSTITAHHMGVFTVSKTIIDNCKINTLYYGVGGSFIPAVYAGNDLTIRGSETEIKTRDDGNEAIAITYDAPGYTLLVEDGEIFGRDHGIFQVNGNITITGGEITSYTLAPVYLQSEIGDVFTIRDGTIKATDGMDSPGIYVYYQSDMDIVMSGGEVSGNDAIAAEAWSSFVPESDITISGGKLTATDYDGSALNYWGQGSVVISGGTFEGGQYGIRIGNSSATLNVSPAVGEKVIAQGTTSAIQTAGAEDYSAVRYAFADENFYGNTKRSGAIPFTNSSAYKYVELISGYAVTVNGGTANGSSRAVVAPGGRVNITPTSTDKAFVRWQASGITLSDPEAGTQTFIMPSKNVTLTAVYESITTGGYSPPTYILFPEVTLIYDTTAQKDDYILVIATLNKSGTVNSTETVKDMTEAHEKAVAESISKIYLKIPTGGKGISKSAMKAVYKAAGGTKLYFTFGFYELQDDGETEEDIGTFFFPLNDKSGQILTGITFGDSQIANKWDTDILGSFETTHKGGWGETAEVSMSIDRLGFAADDGERVYALIYDTKAKKWYQTSAKIQDGFVTFKTSYSGIFTIVTKSVK